MPVARNPYSGWAALLYQRLANRGGYDPADISGQFSPQDYNNVEPTVDSTPPPSTLNPSSYGPGPEPAPGNWYYGAKGNYVPYPSPGENYPKPGGWTADAKSKNTATVPIDWQNNANGQTWQFNSASNPPKKSIFQFGKPKSATPPSSSKPLGTGGPTGFDFRSGGFSSRMNPRGGGWSPAMSAFLGNLALQNYGGSAPTRTPGGLVGGPSIHYL